jgi:phosphatidylglycerol:prolipoprotein diacylglycerol transferase
MREGFYIGPFLVHYYGILIMLGVLAATWLTIRMLKDSGVDSEVVWELLPWTVIAGIIGARIWHILTPPQSMVDLGITTGYYLSHPLDAIAIWKGGLGIPGAVIGGALALWLQARRRKLSFLVLVDAVAPGLALAQAIGRWGNFINQEVYGMPSNLPWAIFIDPAHRIPEFADQATYHPLFLYESILNLIIMGILVWVTFRFKKNRIPGMIFQLYLILYPVVRFMLEFLRLDTSHVGGINANQTLMAVIGLSSLGILIWRLNRNRAHQDTQE